MQLFGLFRKKKQSMTPKAAAAALASRVMIGPEAKAFPDLDEEHLRSIKHLIHLADAGIVIKWLRLLEQGLSNPEKSRAREILKEFERLTFSAASPEEALTLAKELQTLTCQTTRLQEIIKDKKMSSIEYSLKTLAWSKAWLAPVFGNEDELERASTRYGPSLVAHVQGSIKTIGKSVEEIVLRQDRA